MSIREGIEKHKGMAIGMTLGVIAIAVVGIGWQMRSDPLPENAQLARKAFYSDDDGQTWFTADANQLPPFDHDGKQAFRAVVFRGADGHPFVGYLQRVPDRLRASLDATPTLHPGETPPLKIGPQTPLDVRKPGQTKWISPANVAEYKQVVQAVGPDGSSTVTMVQPTDPDSGAKN